jgi:RHS repeat-associated protein
LNDLVEQGEMPVNEAMEKKIGSGNGKRGGKLPALVQSAALALLLVALPLSAPAQTTGGFVASSLSSSIQTGPLPVTFQSPVSDLRVKVWGGEIVVQRGYAGGKWHPNLNWMPLAFTYDSFDNSIKTITRSRTEYAKAAAGVYQDQNGNLLRQTASGFRWNNPAGDWIEYNPAGEIKAYGNRNGTVATFQYTGGTGSTTTGAPASEGRIAGILDHHGAQALWLDYDASNQLIRIRDAANRKVEYQWTTGGSHTVLDADGQTWTYTVTGQGAGISVTDPDNHATARTWNTNGQLSGITLADGSKTVIAQDYDSAKNILYTRETAPGGKITETWSDLNQDRGRGELQRRDINGVTVEKQSLDTATRTTTVTDARGLDTAITRDQWKNITRIRYPDGSTVENQYTPGTDNPTQHVDENGVTTQYNYDANGNLLKIVEAVGRTEQRTTEYTYDANGQRTGMTRRGDANSMDAVTQYAYDNNGNVTTVTDAEGGITRYTRDAMGNPLTITDPRGKVWKRTYDNRGHLLGITDPLNRTTQIAYTKAGLPATLTDAAGNVSTLTYDAAGKLLSVTDPYGANTRYGYDAAGNVTQLTDAENHSQTQEYDLNDRLVKQTDGNGNVTQFVYGDQASGLNGLLIKIVYPTLNQDLQYDQRNRITRSTDSATGNALALDGASNQTTQSQYDAAGNLTDVTDPAARNTSSSYNAFGEITRSTDPAGGATQYGYDARGNLVTVTDAKGNIHRFEYDKLDRMVKEIRPLGQTIVYAYDANGNLIQVTDPKGQIKKYTFDAANRRTKEDHYAAGNTTTPVKGITYTYNTLDRLTGYSDGNTIATYTYDAKQLRQTGESINYGGFTLATTTNYNALGQKTSVTYPDGATYNYTYDANNQLSTAGLPTGFGSITINSYLWTVPAQITLPGGTVRSQQYDGLLRLKNLGVKDPGQSQVMNYQYGYDLTGNIVSKATEQGTTNYSYDTLDRLTGAAYTGQATAQANETYTYDPVANRTGSAHTANWTYNANNQLTAAGSITYTYDENGNTTKQTDASNATNTRSYVYDTDNRLIEVHDAGNAIVAVYSYDPFGRRLSKDTGNSKTYYFYNAEGLIAEADATGQLTRSYGYAPGSTFGTNPLWLKSGNAYYTYQNDHLGTPMKLLNQSGVTVWSATYDAFGNATVDPNSTVTNNLRFPGQYADQETGLHYNWMRYYDPATGRYVTSDPIGLMGGINFYAYTAGNPVNYTDSTGLIFDTIADAAFVLYDVYRLAKDYQNGCDNTGDNLAALGADLLGLITPGATGLGMGVRASRSGAKSVNIKNIQAAENAFAKNNIVGSKVSYLPKPPTGPGSVPKSERDPKRLFTPPEREAKRAEQGHECANGCGTKIDESNSAGHHIERHADGGRTVSENHAEVCIHCHKDLHSGE